MLDNEETLSMPGVADAAGETNVSEEVHVAEGALVGEVAEGAPVSEVVEEAPVVDMGQVVGEAEGALVGEVREVAEETAASNMGKAVETAEVAEVVNMREEAEVVAAAQPSVQQAASSATQPQSVLQPAMQPAVQSVPAAQAPSVQSVPAAQAPSAQSATQPAAQPSAQASSFAQTQPQPQSQTQPQAPYSQAPYYGYAAPQPYTYGAAYGQAAPAPSAQAAQQAQYHYSQAAYGTYAGQTAPMPYGAPTAQQGQAANGAHAAQYGQAAHVAGHASTAPHASVPAHASTAAHAAASGATAAVGTAKANAAKQNKQNNQNKQSTQSKTAKTFGVAFAGAALACALFIGGFAAYCSLNDLSLGSGTTTVIGSTSSTSISASDEDVTLAEAVAEKALPSVVAIDVYTTTSYMYGFGLGSSDSSELTESSLGSGVVLSEDGYIITNYHVIEDGDAFYVTIEGEEYEAEVVGYDASSDIAVIKAVDASGLTPIEIGDSSEITIGEWVMTIGSPFGLEQSVATGIVSATSRSQILSSETDGTTMIYANLIQTDAAINPGNSGGALVDADGKLIGINTLITSYSGNYSGVGFAIPANYAISIAEQIMNGETPTHAQLGVTMTTINSSIASRYGLAVDEGAYVSSVTEGSGADNAGIQVGDIITSFNNTTITSADDLMLAVRSVDPGDTVEVVLNRDGETITLDVTLGSDGTTTSSTSRQSQSLG